MSSEPYPIDAAPINAVASMTSDDSVRAATGRTPEEWFALLDAGQATTWGHTRIARRLVDEHGVDGWWAQNLTVRYEQARGLRRPGQKADGTFAASAGRTVADGRAGLEAVIAAATSELGCAPASQREHPVRPNARWALPGGERVLAAIEPLGGAAGGAAGAPVPSKARLAVTFEKLADEDAAAAAKARAVAILDAALG
ncbi:DUF4287 domain-containing protein [Schumannella sp. 10F1B-5-1]|uniref:DUF4287 domain-containing protein n=1 Tax=Schumannella sp. 10F1B-5-1 TaxID=2590780 RepID=UPI00113269D1|nr:DUF4287 domain-containing protein [Schumannella sp. 10F1B-5-1]TPW72993.1 DUF4287 domain-containing protein [Schumannella sp. 10F1B-5-1]